MKLFEIIGLGDDNVLGKLMNDATLSLKKIQQGSNKEQRLLATGLLSSICAFEANPNILQTDGHSLTKFLQMISKDGVDTKTLRLVSDAFGSYSDDSSD